MDKKGLFFAVTLGWCGGYRFYKKQYLLGVLYFFTFGFFCIGWIIDIIASVSSTAVTKNKPNEITRFHTKVVGVTFESTQGGYEFRQDAIENMRARDTLSLKYYDFNGSPAYMVFINRNYSDIGNLSADLANEIYKKYNQNSIQIASWEKTGGDGRNYGCNIEIVIY